MNCTPDGEGMNGINRPFQVLGMRSLGIVSDEDSPFLDLVEARVKEHDDIYFESYVDVWQDNKGHPNSVAIFLQRPPKRTELVLLKKRVNEFVAEFAKSEYGSQITVLGLRMVKEETSMTEKKL